MPLTNDGLNEITKLLVGQGTALTPSTAYIGVGDGTQIFDETQTMLQGINTQLRLVDAGHPELNNGVITLKASFPVDQANFDWNEWGIFNGGSNGTSTMITRLKEANGTKVSGQTWIFTVTLTLTNN